MIVAPKSTLRNESGRVGECLHFLSYLYPDRGVQRNFWHGTQKELKKFVPYTKKILTL